MQAQRIPNMGSTEWLSIREWHKRTVKDCHCKGCLAEIAAENAAHQAAVNRLLDSWAIAPIGKVGAR